MEGRFHKSIQEKKRLHPDTEHFKMEPAAV